MLLGSSTPYIRAEDGRIVAQSQGLLETFEFYETLVGRRGNRTLLAQRRRHRAAHGCA